MIVIAVLVTLTTLVVFYLAESPGALAAAAVWTAAAAWLLCHVHQKIDGTGSPRSVAAAGWHACLRAECRKADIQRHSLLDKAVAGAVLLVMASAVVFFTTDGLSTHLADWEVLPAAYIGLFGLACWVFDQTRMHPPGTVSPSVRQGRGHPAD